MAKAKAGKRKATPATETSAPKKAKVAPKTPVKKPSEKTTPKKIAASTSKNQSVTVPPPAPSVTPTTTPATAAASPTKSPAKSKDLTDEVKDVLCTLAANTKLGIKLTATDFKCMTNQNLKDVLKLNDRTSTGNRDMLLNSLIECMSLGCPPRCPSCGGGRLRFGYDKVKKKGKKDKFWCPGYMEDDEFINCRFQAEKNEVTRIPFVCP